MKKLLFFQVAFLGYYFLPLFFLDGVHGRWNFSKIKVRGSGKKQQQQQEEKCRWHHRGGGLLQKSVKRRQKQAVEEQQRKQELRRSWKEKVIKWKRPRKKVKEEKELRKSFRSRLERKMDESSVRPPRQNNEQPNNDENQKTSARSQKSKRPKDANKKVAHLPGSDPIDTAKLNKRVLKRQTRTNATDGTSLSCSSFTTPSRSSFLRRHRDSENADTAYRMAILSSLAYWEFHKLKRHNANRMTNFRLLSDGEESTAQKSNRIRTSAKVALCHVAAGMGNSNTIVNQHYNKRNQSHQQNPSCRRVDVSRRSKSGLVYDFQWYLYDWHEPTPLAGKWHDTDLLIATSGDDTLVLSFAGTASAADAVTNVQTFEKVSHSGIFSSVEKGSIHRGFLNAYSRVERGGVSRVCSASHHDHTCDNLYNSLTSSLYQRYQHCDEDAEESSENGTLKTNSTTAKQDKRSKRRKCKGRDEKLMHILREVVNTALLAGHKVHLTGHSLGGGLATLMALDVILNFRSVPISKLHLWTFGAPEVADEVFLQSAMNASRRLRGYIQSRRYHRYVTLSDKCKADVVSTIASKTLAAHKKRGIHGRIARRLGGVGGRVVHISEPHYLPPLLLINGTTATAENDDIVPETKTGSTLGVHHVTSYLQGISRESPSHPLMSNLPPQVSEFVGEVAPR